MYRGFGIIIAMLTKKWILTTIISVIGVLILIRLGIWQLDRLEQRRNFNAHVVSMLSQPEMNLNSYTGKATLSEMEYRDVRVSGVYDFDNQVVLRNQAWNNQIGVHLLTPLLIDGTELAVLIDRGWIPLADMARADWGIYDEMSDVEVRGIARAAQSKPDFGNRTDPTPIPGERLDAWHLANISEMDKQIPHELLNGYIQQKPDDGWSSLPYRSQPDLEISEGPHFGYAIQWFTFAAILAVGYPYFVLKENSAGEDPKEIKSE